MARGGLAHAAKAATRPTRRCGCGTNGSRRQPHRAGESMLCGVYRPIRTFEFNPSIRLPKLSRVSDRGKGPSVVAQGWRREEKQSTVRKFRVGYRSVCARFSATMERIGTNPLRSSHNEIAQAARTRPIFRLPVSDAAGFPAMSGGGTTAPPGLPRALTPLRRQRPPIGPAETT